MTSLKNYSIIFGILRGDKNGRSTKKKREKEETEHESVNHKEGEATSQEGLFRIIWLDEPKRTVRLQYCGYFFILFFLFSMLPLTWLLRLAIDFYYYCLMYKSIRWSKI
jgi:hypothetical protein